MTRITGNEQELAEYQQAVREDRSLAPPVKLLLLLFTLHYPDIAMTQVDIAADGGRSVRTARFHLATALKKGWITREHPYSHVNGGRLPSRYELVVQEKTPGEG
jgi:hypothetical protein